MAVAGAATVASLSIAVFKHGGLAEPSPPSESQSSIGGFLPAGPNGEWPPPMLPVDEQSREAEVSVRPDDKLLRVELADHLAKAGKLAEAKREYEAVLWPARPRSNSSEDPLHLHKYMELCSAEGDKTGIARSIAKLQEPSFAERLPRVDIETENQARAALAYLASRSVKLQERHAEAARLCIKASELDSSVFEYHFTASSRLCTAAGDSMQITSFQAARNHLDEAAEWAKRAEKLAQTSEQQKQLTQLLGRIERREYVLKRKLQAAGQ